MNSRFLAGLLEEGTIKTSGIEEGPRDLSVPGGENVGQYNWRQVLLPLNGGWCHSNPQISVPSLLLLLQTISDVASLPCPSTFLLPHMAAPQLAVLQFCLRALTSPL